MDPAARDAATKKRVDDMAAQYKKELEDKIRRDYIAKLKRDAVHATRRATRAPRTRCGAPGLFVYIHVCDTSSALPFFRTTRGVGERARLAPRPCLSLKRRAKKKASASRAVKHRRGEPAICFG